MAKQPSSRTERDFRDADEALAYTRTPEFRQRFEAAQETMRTLSIQVTPGDAEMVASWAAEGLTGKDNPVAREALRRFRAAFNAAAQECNQPGEASQEATRRLSP